MRIYLQGTYRYRSAEGVFTTVLVAAFGVGFLCFVPMLHGAWKLLPAAPGLILLGIAIEAWVKVRAGVILEISISDDGVRVGDAFWAWQDIHWLFAEGSPGKSAIDLKLLPIRTFGFAEGVPVRPRLSPRQYEALIAELEKTVGRHYPKLKLGGYMGQSSAHKRGMDAQSYDNSPRAYGAGRATGDERAVLVPGAPIFVLISTRYWLLATIVQ